MTNIYTVARTDGDDREFGLTLAAAAHRILTHDGCEYDIQPRDDGEGFDLWSRQEVAGIAWGKTSFFSLEIDKDAAEQDIFQRVVDASNGVNWRGLIAEPQDSYRDMIQKMCDETSDDDERALYEAQLSEIDRA